MFVDLIYLVDAITTGMLSFHYTNDGLLNTQMFV